MEPENATRTAAPKPPKRFPSAGAAVIALLVIALLYSFVAGKKPSTADAPAKPRPSVQITGEPVARNAIAAIVNGRQRQQIDNAARHTAPPTPETPEAAGGPPTGTDLSEPLAGGKTRLRVRNEMPLDAAVAILDGATAEVVRYLYVRANDSHMIDDLADGSYAVSFLAGKDWDASEGRFRKAQASGSMNGYVSLNAREQIQMVLLRHYPYAEVFDPAREADARAEREGRAARKPR